jgi:hypothetical protein
MPGRSPTWSISSSHDPSTARLCHVSEATSADIAVDGVERGHRTLVVTRNGPKVVTIPLAPRLARATDPAIPSWSSQDAAADRHTLEALAEPPFWYVMVSVDRRSGS